MGAEIAGKVEWARMGKATPCGGWIEKGALIINVPNQVR